MIKSGNIFRARVTAADVTFDNNLRLSGDGAAGQKKMGGLYKNNEKYGPKFSLNPAVLSLFRQKALEERKTSIVNDNVNINDNSKDFVIVLPAEEKHIFGGDIDPEEEYPLYVKNEALFNRIKIRNAYIWYNEILKKDPAGFLIKDLEFINKQETFTICKKYMSNQFPKNIFPMRWSPSAYGFIMDGITFHVVKPAVALIIDDAIAAADLS